MSSSQDSEINRLLMRPLMWLAVTGFLLSAAVNIYSFFGTTNPFGSAVWVLHIGIFVIGIPAVLVHSGGHLETSDIFRGCPSWVKRGMYILFPYAFLIFVVGPGPEGLRAFSSIWMIFYYADAAMLYDDGAKTTGAS